MHARCWEYKTVKISAKGWLLGGKLDQVQFDKILNELGADGWELVSILATTQTYGASRDIAAVFKRQKEAHPGTSADQPREDRIRASCPSCRRARQLRCVVP